MDVALVRWPAEAAKREAMVLASAPRLLLLEDGLAPPDALDCLEDWIRVPADEVDLHARMMWLSRRAECHEAAAPALDDQGVLSYKSRWVSLPAIEVRLTAILLERFGRVVPREVLVRAAWADGPPVRRNALDVRVLRLRRRLEPIGLSISTVRSRGYLLEATDLRQMPGRPA